MKVVEEPSSPLAQMLHENVMNQEIANAVHRFFAAVDSREWDVVQALMTDPFYLDYSSFGAGPGSNLAPADVVSGWKGMLPGFDATHHQLGPLATELEGDRAVVRCTATATHHIAGAEGGAIWTVYGDYILTLSKADGWKLAANIFNFRFLTGNPALPALAQARAAAHITE